MTLYQTCVLKVLLAIHRSLANKVDSQDLEAEINYCIERRPK